MTILLLFLANKQCPAGERYRYLVLKGCVTFVSWEFGFENYDFVVIVHHHLLSKIENDDREIDFD